MIDSEEVLGRMTDDDIHIVLVAVDGDDEAPKLKMGEEDAHNFISAVLETVVYLIEEKLTPQDFAFGTCDCATPITPATIERGYCYVCLRDVTVKIGDPKNVNLRRASTR